MPKFEVCLGRLVREVAHVVVEAESLQFLEDNLRLVYDQYDHWCWESDDEWGCEESDSHAIVGEADPNAVIEVSLIDEEEEEEDHV